jgi:hypothetical protein
MPFLVQTPPNLKGGSTEQLKQLYTYLFQMSEQINYALNSIDSGAIVTADRTLASPTSSPGQTEAQTQYSSETYNELRALIQKTGDAVNKSVISLEKNFSEKTDSQEKSIQEITKDVTKNSENIEELTLALENDYVSSSAFGDYMEGQKMAISASASGLVQQYKLDTVLTAADEIASFKTWQSTTEGYIKTGLLFYEEDGVGKYGVAISEDLSQVIVDGVVQRESSNLLATFTAGKLSFWMHGMEAAYFSNQALYVTNVTVLGGLEVANLLVTKNQKGTIIKWVGA